MMCWHIGALVIISTIYAVVGTKCLRNDDIGWRKENIYECNDPEKPVCCEQDHRFVCCERNGYKVMEKMKSIVLRKTGLSKHLVPQLLDQAWYSPTREQLQLWFSVFGFCLALYLVYTYYRRDSCSRSGWTDGFP